ncbi:phosphatidylserine decarboxylase [Pseudoalteromonas luteoviolacea]|uniref:phosphatidylserine decarboxylase n=1 Tax=Pseudoalteromonas luteoviolacea TaxID=43657 RepID=UPI00114FDD39|nr:phosphatidylserine decarboxylase [Pseudoalteromonas luteoviolacea]TQF71406.1 phosphatidylserine decarboxylase [Pseudoalteromonas luteoviolacea]
MSSITPISLPVPCIWSEHKKACDTHINKLTALFEQNPQYKYLYLGALSELCIETNIKRRKEVASYWLPYLYQQSGYTLTHFFKKWLTYTPTPSNPGEYIEYWDYLVNTETGLQLANQPPFKNWFKKFLNCHGKWINSTDSITTLPEWVKYTGTKEHPFDINNYELPDPKSPTGGFKSFNQFFLRNLKPNQRPEAEAPVIAPCDGGIFFLTQESKNVGKHQSYLLPNKSGDEFNLIEAIPGYGRLFVGGPLLDALLWFTDYHHFHAPVTGTVIEQGLYPGSYNYDFDDFDPNDPYGPLAPSNSDKAGWYQKLAKHQRYVWVIKTERLGLVAMVAIGFWGVGSITNAISTGEKIQSGQYMGHFGYGGSSIVLAFEPGKNLDFKVADKKIKGPDKPRLMKVRESLAAVKSGINH